MCYVTLSFSIKIFFQLYWLCNFAFIFQVHPYVNYLGRMASSANTSRPWGLTLMEIQGIRLGLRETSLLGRDRVSSDGREGQTVCQSPFLPRRQQKSQGSTLGPWQKGWRSRRRSIGRQRKRLSTMSQVSTPPASWISSGTLSSMMRRFFRRKIPSSTGGVPIYSVSFTNSFSTKLSCVGRMKVHMLIPISRGCNFVLYTKSELVEISAVDKKVGRH